MCPRAHHPVGLAFVSQQQACGALSNLASVPTLPFQLEPGDDGTVMVAVLNPSLAETLSELLQAGVDPSLGRDNAHFALHMSRQERTSRLEPVRTVPSEQAAM